MNRIHPVVIAFAALMFAYCLCAFAGAPFPMIRASSSSNGKFLVIAEYQYENPAETIRRINKIIYHVDQREDFINDQFTTLAAYWSDSGSWNVHLDWPKGVMGGLLPYISDDGEILVFISVTPPFSGIEILKIYRKDGNQGAMLKAYQLKDIWTPAEMNSHADLISNGRPLWFTGGSFSFSSDNQQFIHKTPWGKIIRINLQDGSVSRE